MHILPLWLFRSPMFYGTSITLKISFWNWKERKCQIMGLHDLCVVLSMTLRTLNNSFLLPRLWEFIVKANNCSCFYRSYNHLAAQSARKHVRRSYFQVYFLVQTIYFIQYLVIGWAAVFYCHKNLFWSKLYGLKTNVLYLKIPIYVCLCFDFCI